MIRRRVRAGNPRPGMRPRRSLPRLGQITKPKPRPPGQRLRPTALPCLVLRLVKSQSVTIAAVCPPGHRRSCRDTAPGCNCQTPRKALASADRRQQVVDEPQHRHENLVGLARRRTQAELAEIAQRDGASPRPRRGYVALADRLVYSLNSDSKRDHQSPRSSRGMMRARTMKIPPTAMLAITNATPRIIVLLVPAAGPAQMGSRQCANLRVRVSAPRSCRRRTPQGLANE